MTKKTTKALALAAVLTIGAGMMTTFAGCGDSTTTPTESSGTGTTATDASSKKLTIGSAAYRPGNELCKLVYVPLWNW